MADGRRTERQEIRLTPEEKKMLSELSKDMHMTASGVLVHLITEAHRKMKRNKRASEN